MNEKFTKKLPNKVNRMEEKMSKLDKESSLRSASSI